MKDEYKEMNEKQKDKEHIGAMRVIFRATDKLKFDSGDKIRSIFKEFEDKFNIPKHGLEDYTTIQYFKVYAPGYDPDGGGSVLTFAIGCATRILSQLLKRYNIEYKDYKTTGKE